jgi:hypothetical protein
MTIKRKYNIKVGQALISRDNPPIFGMIVEGHGRKDMTDCYHVWRVEWCQTNFNREPKSLWHTDREIQALIPVYLRYKRNLKL